MDLFKKYHLPKRIEVNLQKTKEGGFMVEFPGLPGCFTQVNDLSELDDQVTDAVLTYFDVSRSDANKVVYLQETKRPSSVPAQTKFDLFVAA